MHLRINFYPEYDDPLLVERSKYHQEIWNTEGEKITTAIRKYTSLDFVETKINAITSYQGSTSHPFVLYYQAASGRLIHELLHRILVGNNIEIPNKRLNPKLEIHKVLNLVLYDIWVELYGKDFADKQVAIECEFKDIEYQQAWQYALSLTPEQRKAEFQKILNNSPRI